MRLTRFEWGCAAVIAAAALMRALFVLQPTFIWDSAWFLLLARSFGETGTFLLPWSDPANPQYSGYWPPLFPIFVSPFVALFGPSYKTLVLASGTAGMLLVLGVFLTTRDLFDRRRAFAAAALVAASPTFYVTDAKGMSESLLALMVVLTLWAFLKSLEKPLWLPVAALFAFLAYLGKASLGLPLVAAGILALAAWRVYTRGWRAVVRSPVDVGVAVIGLAGIAFLAATRTERIGGLGLGLIEPLRRGVVNADCGQLVGQLLAIPQPFVATGPHCWAFAFPLKIVFVAAFLFVVTLPLSLRLPALLRQARTERTDAIWLAVVLPMVAGAVFTTTFFYTERRSFVDFDNLRYLTPAVVPFIWLLLPLWTFEDEPRAKDADVRRPHLAAYWIAVGAFVALLMLNPLTGSETLERFVLLTLLALVAVGISFYARGAQYGVAERRGPSGLELRFVPQRAKPEARRVVTIAALVLILGGWFYSSWYAIVGYGLVIALATPLPSRRFVAMTVVLLVSAAPTVFPALPVEAMSRATRDVPEGTVMGMSDIIVYTAAGAPEQVEMRLVDPEEPIPEDVDLLVMQTDLGLREYDNFTKLHTWDFQFQVWPTLHVRLWIEENVLGRDVLFFPHPGLTLYARNGTGIEQHVHV